MILDRIPLWFGTSLIMIRVGRFIWPVCGWRRLWAWFGTDSTKNWTKRGVPRGATQPLGRLHRQRASAGGLTGEEVQRKKVEEIRGNLQAPEPEEEKDLPQRQAQFQELIDGLCVAQGDSFHEHLAKVMSSFQPGLLAGGDEVDQIRDKNPIRRCWFRGSSKGMSVGSTVTNMPVFGSSEEGSTTALALDENRVHCVLFTVDHLLPYCSARMPECQRQAMNRREITDKGPIQNPNDPNCWSSWNAGSQSVLSCV